MEAGSSEAARVEVRRERLTAVLARTEGDGDARARWRASVEAALVAIDELESRCGALMA